MLVRGSPAEAFLGIGEPSSEEVYKADTVRSKSTLEARPDFHAEAMQVCADSISAARHEYG